MANYIETTRIDAKRFVPVSSRYADAEVIYYTENKLLTFVIYRKRATILNKRDKFAIITPGSEYRPDIVSQKAYGTPDFWWKIMEANGLKDVFEFKAGLNIRLPDAIFG